MAVLLGFTALVTALAPRPTVSPTPGDASATPSPERSATAGTAGSSRVVTRTVDADAGVRSAHVRARAGDTIRLAVRGDILDAVELRGLGKIEPVEPGSPARFELLAEAAGEHAIVLLDANRRVGLLDIRARER